MMPKLSVNHIWVLLLLATTVTWWLGESGLMGTGGMIPVLMIFGLSLIKGLWVINDFMALRHAPILWLRVMVAWLSFVIGLILLAYWISLP
jgi:hypothetical protein